jgi:hypothetical protein
MCTGVHVRRTGGHFSSTQGRKPFGFQSLRRGILISQAVFYREKLVNKDMPNSTDVGAEESKLLSVASQRTVSR